MNVIKPTPLADSNFTYSDVLEPDTGEVLWVAGANYTLSTEVIRPTTHRKYKNILAGIDAGLPENTPLRWVESGVTNKWAAIDLLRNTQSMRANVLTMKFTLTEFVDSAGIIGLVGQSFNIKVVSRGVQVYDYSQSLYKRAARTWYNWFFGQLQQIESAVRLDLPIYANPEITLTIYNEGGIAKCGGIVLGRKVYIGNIEYGSSGDDLNFSKFDRAFDGTSLLLQRRSVPTVDGGLSVAKANVDIIRNLKKTLNAVPTIWTGMEDENIDDYFELFLIYGIYKKFSINAEHPTHAKITLQLEEF